MRLCCAAAMRACVHVMMSRSVHRVTHAADHSHCCDYQRGYPVRLLVDRWARPNLQATEKRGAARTMLRQPFFSEVGML